MLLVHEAEAERIGDAVDQVEREAHVDRVLDGVLAHADAQDRREVADIATITDLLATLDGYQPGQLAPLQRAEHDLARARLAASNTDAGTGVAFAAAITGLRQHSTPYHLAHGLLDHAAHLLRQGDDEAATAAIGEARDIAEQLRCQPLLDRADTTQPATPHATV